MKRVAAAMISSEKKLELLRQIRIENKINRMKVKDREAFLYGNPSQMQTRVREEDMPLLAGSGWHSEEWEEQFGQSKAEQAAPFSSFRIRLFIALALLGAFFYFSRTDAQLLGYDGRWLTSRISGALQEKWDTNPFAFIEGLPYTKEDEAKRRTEQNADETGALR